MQNENMGAAERIIQSLLTFTDHMVHNRPGMVVPDARFNIGVRWEPVTHAVENGENVVYKMTKVGKTITKTRIGVMRADRKVIEGSREMGEYRQAGLYPEVVAWMYQQVAEVWKLDNEFAARWASYAFGQEHRDLKVILCAFMLVQSRKGDPVLDGGKVAFHDEDYRDIGEAMVLLRRKDGKDLSPKLLLRVHDVLVLPQIAALNRELGFGKSARKPFLGRWNKAVEKWLEYREENEKLLEGLVSAAYRTTVMELARKVGYRPVTTKFFDLLRWKQKQADDGRRTLSIGKAVGAAESYEGLTEEQICQRVLADKPDLKRLTSLLPKNIGKTKAIMAAAVEAGSLSDKDLVIATPTLEELGLLQDPDVRQRWEKAVKASEDLRAANIATRVKSKATAEVLQQGADAAAQKAVEEVLRGIRVYFMVDVSSSMQGAIESAKDQIAKFAQAFPLDKLHVSVFNTAGREVAIRHASSAGVQNAFRNIAASGGTDYGAGVRALAHHKPSEEEDTIFIFVGDEEANVFADAVRASKLRPISFGFLKVKGTPGYTAVTSTARELGVPCFMIDTNTFSDPYAIPRTIRNLVAATPVGQVPRQVTQAPRVTLVETILKTDLLQKPAWAA